MDNLTWGAMGDGISSVTPLVESKCKLPVNDGTTNYRKTTIANKTNYGPVKISDLTTLILSSDLELPEGVCKEWNEFSTVIKKSRQKIEWLLSECSEEDDANIIAEKIKTFTEELDSEPKYVLLFCTTKLYERPIRVPSAHPSRHPRNAKCEVMQIGDYLHKLLPKDCSLLAISADGVVGTSGKTNTILELEDTDAMTLLSLPKMDGLDTYTFFVDIYTYANRMDENSTGVFDVSQVSTVPEDKDVKVILFFCDEPFCPPEIGYTLLQHYKGCVIAGGYVDNLISPEKCSHENMVHSEASLMCIALCGPRVHAASVVIREEVNTAEAIEKIIKKLKDCNLPEGKSFAFMFACIGRGKAHYNGVENAESKIFKKYFPNTPLFGFFGNGEVGFDHLHKYSANSTRDNGSSSSSQTNNKPLPKLYHAYTTIICMVSIT